MDDDRWFDEVREAYSIGWVRAESIEDFMGGRPLSPADVEYGWRLGLLDAESRADRGQAGAMSASFSPAEEARARKLWLGYVLSALATWWETNGDPRRELSEVLSPWRQEAGQAWDQLRPRGFDKICFGSAARSRLVNRLRNFAYELARG